jgi:hypothetical protein
MTHAGASTAYFISTIRGAATNEPEGLTFKENATERMRIDSSGDVLIDTTSSTTWNGGTTKRILAVANANSGDANAIVTLKSNASTVDHGGIFEAYSTAVTSGSPALGSIGFVRESTSNTALSSITTFFTNTGGTVSEKLRITSNGNLKISPSAVNNSLLVGRNESNNNYGAISFNNNNLDGSRIGFTGGGSGDNTLYIDTPTSGIFVFRQNTTSAMTLNASGNLLLGTTSGSGNRLDVVGGGIRVSASGTLFNLLEIQDTVDQSGATYVQFLNSTGGNIGNITRVTTTNAVTYNTTSDYRLKTVTGTVTGQGERIDALKPIDYQWKEGNQQARGFLAHEFQTVYPNSVSGNKDAVDADGKPVYQGMQASTAEVIADLVAEIQSLRQRIKTLENK